MHQCITSQLIEHRNQRFPGYQKALDETIYEAKEHVQKHQFKTQQVLHIPVVVHVLFEDSTENLPDSVIHSQIEVLNEDFRRNNPDTNMTRSVFDSLAADARIEFHLARETPDGQPTDGVTRTQTTQTSFMSFSGADQIKFDSTGGKNAWPTDEYLNIWVGDLSLLGQPSALGFAYPPLGAPDSMWPSGQIPNDSSIAGVVIHYEVMGRNNPLSTGVLAPYNRGRTGTHEVGHYLGLRHISGDGNCAANDYIDDTPLQNGGSGGGFGSGSGHHRTCAYQVNTCADAPVDLPDMFENYMDYAPDSCSNLFTKDQIRLMRAMAIHERSSLIDTSAPTDNPITSADLPGRATFQSLHIAPNPTRGQAAINVDFATPKEVRLDVLNNMGQRVQTKIFAASTSIHHSVDLDNQPQGLYVIQLKSGEQVVRRKLLKH